MTSSIEEDAELLSSTKKVQLPITLQLQPVSTKNINMLTIRIYTKHSIAILQDAMPNLYNWFWLM